MSRKNLRKNLRSASIRNNMLTGRELAEMVLGKKCPQCGETDVAKFSKDKHRSDGLQTYCKKCSQRKSLTVNQMVERAVAYVAGKESNAMPAEQQTMPGV